MNSRTNGHPNNQQRGAQPNAAPCTSPWTEAYQAAMPQDWQRSTEDQECQPTLDALSHIYNRGYV